MVAVEGSEKREDVSERRLGRVLNASTTESDSSTVTVNSDDVRTNDRPGAAFGKATPNKTAKSSKVTAHKATTTTKPVAGQPIHSTRAVTRSAGPSVELFRGIEEIVLPPKPKLSSKTSSRNESEIKVKMLTGTLYIYRDKRHVKFVRTK